MDNAQKEYYGIYADKLIECQQSMLDEINSIINELTTNPENNPAEHVLSRIKGVDSIKQKLNNSNFETDAKSGLLNLSDVIGCRIVTHFLDDVYSVLEKINNSQKWEVHKIKDYIKNSKPNGYRSLHIILKIPFGVDGIDFVYTEIQMRTIAMDCWASLEHQLKYKKSVDNVELITNELKRCADEIASTDLTMKSIRSLINNGV